MTRELLWGDVAELRYGKSLREYSHVPSDECRFRVFGTNGPIGWHTGFLVDGPGIVIGRKGAYRGVHFSDQPFSVIDTAYYLDIHDPGVDLTWAFYQLSTVDINRMDSGSAIPSTKREDFYAVPVTVPPLAVQRRIASILSAYDDLIENNRRRMALLEEAARQLYCEWFVRLRFPGHEHTRIIGSVPEGWSRRLGDIVVLKRGFDLPVQDRVEGTVPVVSSSGVTGTHNVPKVEGPGVVTGRYGTLGEVFYLQEDFWPLNTTLYVEDFKGNEPILVVQLLRSLDLGGRSAAGAVPGVNRNVLHMVDVVFPPVGLQTRFAPVFMDIAGLQLRLHQANQKLGAARDLLLPRLMSGEIAV